MRIDNNNSLSCYTMYSDVKRNTVSENQKAEMPDEDIAVSLTLSADAVSATATSTTDYRVIQSNLSALGFYSGPIDGNISSSLSQRAIANFQWVYGLTRTAAMDSNTTQKLSTVMSHYNQAMSNMDALVNNLEWMTSTQKSNVARIWVFFKDGLGLTSEQAAGFLGNIYKESSFKPEAINGSHFGLVQWNSGRQEGLETLAGQMGLTKQDINAQFAWIREELKNDFKTCFANLKSATTVSGATTIIFDQYEKPQDNSLSVRINAAQAIYNSLA